LFNRILKQMQDKIHIHQYVMTLHADEEAYDDNLSVYDIEHAIITGEILERQKDAISGEWKYLVRGQSLENDSIIIIGKLTFTGKLFIITVFRE